MTSSTKHTSAVVPNAWHKASACLPLAPQRQQTSACLHRARTLCGTG